MENEQIEFFIAVAAKAVQLGSLFRNNIPGKDALLEFMDVNGWFGIEHSASAGTFYVRSIDPMEKELTLWLLAYKKSRQEKIALMLQAYQETLPETCRRLREFMDKNSCWNTPTSWKLVDFLLGVLRTEITQYSDEDLRRLLTRANSELTIAGMKHLTEFLRDPAAEPLTDWSYSFSSRQLVAQNRGAYSLEQFSIVAYTVFNEASWREHCLIPKASEKKRYAELWLYTALHFLCAVRASDMKRLPAVSLPYQPEEVRHRIAVGTYSEEDARRVVAELLFRLNAKAIRPSKTSQYSNVPNLKLFVPESIVVPFGIILSLSMSFHNPGDPFVGVSFEAIDVLRFFGETLARILENKKFLSRRANKSYLQGIETEADEDTNVHVKGYMLAALARSHKGGIGSLPEITDIYLRDANFSGYSPVFILREMFERGVFGFVPALLLEAYAGKAYLRLHVHSQTELIRVLGLDAYRLEQISDTVSHSFAQASKIVQSLLHEQHNEQKPLEMTLQAIASGAAPSKQAEFFCLRAAAGYSCIAAERTCCIGCGYEIYTKSAAYLLTQEYLRLTRQKKETDEFNAKRLTAILEKGILPAVSEILYSLPMLYPNSETGIIMDVIERGVLDASHS